MQEAMLMRQLQLTLRYRQPSSLLPTLPLFGREPCSSAIETQSDLDHHSQQKCRVEIDATFDESQTAGRAQETAEKEEAEVGEFRFHLSPRRLLKLVKQRAAQMDQTSWQSWMNH